MTPQKRSAPTVLGVVALILGWLLVVPAVLIVIGMIPDGGNDDFRAAGVLAAVIVISIGVALIGAGRRANRYWICSDCGNRLSDREARLCPACGATGSGNGACLAPKPEAKMHS